MKIDHELKDDVVLFRLGGKLMGGSDATMFHGYLHEYVDSGKRKVVVDLGRVEWMNSVGLGMLIAALSTIKRAEGSLRLCNITDSIESLLTITMLMSVFQVHDSVEEAIASF
jgi:anti-sigma B factor antagonist